MPKVCKIMQKVIQLRESFAYSGQIVRHTTIHTKLQTCGEEEPNCCGNTGCCDNKGWKLFVLISVGVFACILFLSVFSVCLYSAVFHRKKHTGEPIVKASARLTEPRYNMDTYLTVAGYGADTLPEQGPPRSAVQPLEYHAADSSSDSSTDEPEENSSED